MFQSVTKRFEPIPVKLSQESQTVPDMSFTPREILAKFSRGERVPLGFEGLYDDESASPFDEDPTRDPEFDFGDYVEEKRMLDERLAERKAERASAAHGQTPGAPKRKANDDELSASDARKRETTSEGAQERPSTASKAE